jgi:hypothetical protein
MTEDTQQSIQKQRPLTLADLDGRTNAAKTARQMISDLVSDLGGPDALSTAQRTLAQRAAVTAAVVENMEATWLSGHGLDASGYVSLTNSLHKLLTSLGLKRQMRDVETLEGYLAAKTGPPSPAAEPKASFVDPEVVRACVDSGCRERPFVAGKRYSAFVDPSGGSSDSMTLAIGHREGEITVLDVLREVGAPFDPTSVVSEFAATLKGYNVRQVCGDRYAAQWCAQAFEKCGIRYEHSPLNRSEIYLETLPVLNAKRVRLLDNARLISQLSNLERRTSRGGRDSVDHPPSGRDDVSNAACGMVATMRKGPSVTVIDNFLELLNSDNYQVINGERKFVKPSRIYAHPTKGLPSWMR